MPSESPSIQVPCFSKLIVPLINNGVTVGSSGSPSPFGSTSAASIGSSEVSVTGSPLGSSPVAVAVLITSPAFISACVIVYVAVNSVVLHAPGTSIARGPPDMVTSGSVTSILVNTTEPVLHNSKLYVMVSPT